MTSSLVFYVNGQKIVDPNVDPQWTLTAYLRRKLKLCGTKIGCGEGGCGSCTVMFSKYDRINNKIRNYAINSCLALVSSLHGTAIVTVEGIGNVKNGLHPVQERIAKSHGSQCGFCTPGFVMSMYTLLRNNPNPTMDDIQECLTGNLCRCTGYRPILEGFRTFTNENKNEKDNNCTNVENSCSEKELKGFAECGKENCCMNNGIYSCYTKDTKELQNEMDATKPVDAAPRIDENVLGTDYIKTTLMCDTSCFKKYDPNTELIFPPELRINEAYDKEELFFQGRWCKYYRPVTLERLLELKKALPHAKVISGNTETGIEMKTKREPYPIMISTTSIAEMNMIRVTDSCVEFGGCVILTDIEEKLKNIINKLNEDAKDYKVSPFKAILKMLKYFAGNQIKNVATLAGNIVTGSPISDLIPILVVNGAQLVLRSIDSERVIKLDRTFFTSYRKNIMKPEEVLVSIQIFYGNEGEYINAYKQSMREDDDIAIVNSAMKVKLNCHSSFVEEMYFAYGGMGPTVVVLKDELKDFLGKSWSHDLNDEIMEKLANLLELNPSAPGGMVDYRLTLCLSFFFKFFLEIQNKLDLKHIKCNSSRKTEEPIEFNNTSNVQLKSTQMYQQVRPDQSLIDPIGREIPHVSCLQQTTGEAIYVDDMPHFENECYAALVLSTKIAEISRIDASDALKMPGVKGFFSADDLEGDRNITGLTVNDDLIFAKNKTDYVGQIVGVIVAEENYLAQKAAKMVKILYGDEIKPIITIEDAIKANSFFDTLELSNGDVEDELNKSECTLEGKFRIGGQEHFYVEPNAHIAIPRETGELEIYSSNQDIGFVQECTSRMLGIDRNNIVVKTKRLGGGFGGKESRATFICLPAVLAASKLGCPVRIVLDREDDMVYTGQRHAFLSKWKVGFNKQGILNALHVNMFSNAGYSSDLSGPVMFKAVVSVENSYRIPNIKITGNICKTNLPSNTAFRGFGTLQAVAISEYIMAHIAEFLEMDASELKYKNLLMEGDVTNINFKLENCTLHKCWDQVMIQTDYVRKKKSIELFNRNNKYVKRGMSAVPGKFAISFEALRLNQAGALVLIYKDGSVLLSHGGIEMGQGLHTKMIQVAARVLGIDISWIKIMETSTDKVPNASTTAASTGSDLNGMAVLNACNVINERLAPIKEKFPEKDWPFWINKAYIERISLHSTGFYKTDLSSQFDLKTRTGQLTLYYTMGAAISEVEIDCLTGTHKIISTDIVMDVGNSLNPAIDIGQIEGGFIQGAGLFTTEQLRHTPKGALITRGPGSYKVPSVHNIPSEFNVTLLKDSPNPQAVFSSKGIGEPPMIFSLSVFYAIREAIRSYRGDSCFRLDSPATVERIRMACQDKITNMVPNSNKDGNFEPWEVVI